MNPNATREGQTAPGKAPLTCPACGTPYPGGDPSRGCPVCRLRLALNLEATLASEPSAEATPSVDHDWFDHYQLVRLPNGLPNELGRGAMGITFKALDTVLGRTVALKVLDPRTAARPEAQERFLREARAAARLRHPNIASVFYFGVQRADGRCFYAMELVEGETVDSRVRRLGPLPAHVALEIAAQVARAIAAAEHEGLVHRDLKPANLMLVNGPELTVKVIDFGVAKAAALSDETELTHGGFAGTPAFASPEQFTGTGVDVRSDLYSLGITLWVMLTGTTPFRGSCTEVMDRHLHAPLPLEQLKGPPRPVILLLEKLLEKDPAKRFQNAADLLHALTAVRAALRTGRTRKWFLSAATAIVVVAAGASYFFGVQFSLRSSTVRSIAVLPFDNLTEEKDNAFFTAGIQEDIQANLAKVADLKVISQDSVLVACRDRATRPVGQTLGVRYLLEGSVRRSGSVVRVIAQLIDVTADRQVWAERYDRDLSDVFTIQSELAEQITRQLAAKLSAEEKATIDRPPTRDITAYELYLRARDMIEHFGVAANERENLLDGIRLLEEAVKRDPGFVDAFCGMSRAHVILYLMGLDRTPGRRKLAEIALDQATRLNPASGVVHYARAYYFLLCAGDDERAAEELEQARRKLPNDAGIPRFAAEIELKRGLWEEAVRDMEKAFALNPLSVETVHDLSWAYAYLHRYGDAVRTIDRWMAAGLRSNVLTMQRARLCFDASGDIGPLHAALQEVGPAYDPDGDTTFTRIAAALWDRDFKEAVRLLNADTHAEFYRDDYAYPRGFVAGLIARAQGDVQGARVAFEAARPLAEHAVHNQPGDARALSILAQVDAGLGRIEDALGEARRAAEILPVSKNADVGTDLAVDLAQVYAWTGHRDLAFQQLRHLVKAPNALSYGELKLDPIWDDLRGDPRFKDLLGELAATIQPVR